MTVELGKDGKKLLQIPGAGRAVMRAITKYSTLLKNGNCITVKLPNGRNVNVSFVSLEQAKHPEVKD